MSFSIEDVTNAYLRAISEYRYAICACILVVSIASLAVIVSLPKKYTSSATIYADNSNILRPLMEGNAVTTAITDQARMAREILFKREFTDQILSAAGMDPQRMSPIQRDNAIATIQANTQIENQGGSQVSLIKISHSDPSPVKAFGIVQTYTSMFIKESVKTKQQESRGAFEFIEAQVASYQSKLQESENRLSNFKSQNNLGTLVASNNRIASYRAEMERIELELVQLDTQIASVESQLNGEREVSRDLTQINAVRARINALQITLDGLRSRFHDNYPDVVQVQNQISDLQSMLETGQIADFVPPEDMDEQGTTPLHQELRSQLAAFKTNRDSKTSQHAGINQLLIAEEARSRKINETEAELAELTRDYNVTQDFYNQMLQRLENARVSMHLDEEQQGVTFKVQEAAVIPTQPDGMAFSIMVSASLIFAFGVPVGLLIVMMELDNRIKSESNWSENWPPLLATIPPMQETRSRRFSAMALISMTTLSLILIYGGVSYAEMAGYL